MIDVLGQMLVFVAGLTLVTMIGLFTAKLVRHYRARRSAFRAAVYISALGEIVSRSMIPSRDLTAWARDPAFHDTLIDYFRLVDGEDQRLLIELAEQLEIVERFHRDLKTSRRTSARLRAVSGLSVIASEHSRPHLTAALADPVPEVRIGAAAGLSLIGHEDDVKAVLNALEREDRWAAERMADALVRFGPVAVQTLSNYVLLASPGVFPIPNHLAIAVRSLGLIGDPRAETALLTALTGEDALLRIKAAAALTEPWTSKVTRALLRRLSDEDWRVRAQAAKALAGHNDPATLPSLALALRDSAWWVRQDAAEAMAEIDGGIDALFQALEDEDAFAVDAALAQLMAHGSLATENPEHQAILAKLGRAHLTEMETG